MNDPETCEHVNVVPEVCDQTLGVACNDCNTILGACWSDKHVSEKLWNRACKNVPDEGYKPCVQDRDDVCFMCGDSTVPCDCMDCSIADEPTH